MRYHVGQVETCIQLGIIRQTTDIIGTSTYYSKQFFSLISLVMDDTCKTAISKINQLVFERLINVLNFSNFI
jgi:hypothetical protein